MSEDQGQEVKFFSASRAACYLYVSAFQTNLIKLGQKRSHKISGNQYKFQIWIHQSKHQLQVNQAPAAAAVSFITIYQRINKAHCVLIGRGKTRVLIAINSETNFTISQQRTQICLIMKLGGGRKHSSRTALTLCHILSASSRLLNTCCINRDRTQLIVHSYRQNHSACFI